MQIQHDVRLSDRWTHLCKWVPSSLVLLNILTGSDTGNKRLCLRTDEWSMDDTVFILNTSLNILLWNRSAGDSTDPIQELNGPLCVCVYWCSLTSEPTWLPVKGNGVQLGNDGTHLQHTFSTQIENGGLGRATHTLPFTLMGPKWSVWLASSSWVSISLRTFPGLSTPPLWSKRCNRVSGAFPLRRQGRQSLLKEIINITKI